MNRYDVITSGYVSMDHMLKIKSPARVGFTSLIENSTNTRIYYGGCSVNIAYALCRLGLSAMPVIRVGDDYEENGFARFLRDGNVPTGAVTAVAGEKTSVCYLVQDSAGQHITLFYPGAMDGKYVSALPDDYFRGTRLGVITVASYPDNREFFDRCRHNGVPVVFGMKSDFDAFPEPFLRELLLSSSIIFTNAKERAEIESLLGIESITDLFEVGKCDVVVTTYGKKGSSYYSRLPDGTIDTACIPICDCACVTDATGSGDAYMAGFIYAYLDGMPLGDCCRMGSTLSSFIVEKEGCCTNAPDKKALLSRFSEFRACSIEKGKND